MKFDIEKFVFTIVVAYLVRCLTFFKCIISTLSALVLYNLIHFIRIRIKIILLMLHSGAVVNYSSLTYCRVAQPSPHNLDVTHTHTHTHTDRQTEALSKKHNALASIVRLCSNMTE